MNRSADTARAIGLMVLGMAGFAVEDFLIKRVAGDLPLWLILLVAALGGAAIFAVLCRRDGLPLFTAALRHPLVIVRNLGEGIAAVSFITALTLIPLSLNSAILQVTPLLVTAGAAIWLGEQVGWRRWTAVGLGFAGVILILRPGLDGFRPAALLTVLASVGLAARDLASRRIPAHVRTLQLSFWAYLTLLPGAALVAVIAPGDPSGPPGAWVQLVLSVFAGALGYAALTTATRIGDVSAVIPFRYTRLVFALILGIAFLGERPDIATLAGAVIVVISGLYAWHRERHA